MYMRKKGAHCLFRAFSWAPVGHSTCCKPWKFYFRFYSSVYC
uniref:Uncharacterized protein n=1 Tax=Anguilla anguilla TaxID=7936 RepID=A0A0E9PDX1_ANGAN